ncbi:IclR family transcriptional regulator [Nocardioides panacisoli]|uniref:IclR family transcriptional regulator n=1 Tax=Nocardioides panacisoli TaxID=627624 RepID=UPI001C63800B|nr:IclR family transcriptional regulator [Nocardioides panacisoli]QYJ03056.1 IclR family transcriptional regulator [Nocardioides panacisoli]
MSGRNVEAVGSVASTRSVTARALSILAAFDTRHRALTLSELARRADLPVATTHRLLGELAAWGAVKRRDSGDYVIGRRLWSVGLLAPVETGLRELASPFLHDLYGATRATVHLAVRDGTQALYLDRLAGHASVPVISEIGVRLPLSTTGVGKVLLAHAPPEVRTEVLAHLRRHTPYTITQPGLLQRQLDRVLEEDIATTTEEMTLGACSIAVPIRRGTEVVASLGVVVPNLQQQAQLASAMQVSARSIGRALSPLSVNGNPT